MLKMDKSEGAAQWPVRFLGTYICALLPLGMIFWSANGFRAVGLNLFPEQYFVAMIGIALFALYLIFPANRSTPRENVPWYDWLIAIISLLSAGYVAVNYPRMVEELFDRKTDAIIVSLILVPAILEGLRRSTGWVLLIVTLCFIIFAMVGHFIPGELQGRKVDTVRMLIFLGIDSNAILGLPTTVVTGVVIAFVFFGTILNRSGGSAFFTDFSLALMGRFRGGSAKIAVIASSLFGSISGSAVSNVVSTGVITIPLMRQSGYSARSAGAIEAVASTGGQLMPPIMGAAAFLMAEFIQVPYTDILWAALIPSILYFSALFIQVDIQAVRDNIKAVDANLIPKLASVLKSGWYYPFPFAVLIYSLFSLKETPAMSALYGSISLFSIWIIFGNRGKRLRPMDVLNVFSETGVSVLSIIMIGAAAGIIIGVLNISSLGFALTLALVKFAGGNLILLLLMAAIVCIVLGMGLPTVGVYILLATLVAPSIVEFGVSTLSAHLFVLYFGMMSMITPPVAIAAFAAASLAGAQPIPTAIESIKFGWTAFVVPFLFIFSPALLFEGDLVLVIGSLATALLGIWLTSLGVMGYARQRLSTGFRLSFVISGLLLLIPFDLFSMALVVNGLGGLLAVITIALTYRPLVKAT